MYFENFKCGNKIRANKISGLGTNGCLKNLVCNIITHFMFANTDCKAKSFRQSQIVITMNVFVFVQNVFNYVLSINFNHSQNHECDSSDCRTNATEIRLTFHELYFEVNIYNRIEYYNDLNNYNCENVREKIKT